MIPKPLVKYWRNGHVLECAIRAVLSKNQVQNLCLSCSLRFRYSLCVVLQGDFLRVAQQFGLGGDILSVCSKHGRQGVPERMPAHSLGYSSAPHCRLQLPQTITFVILTSNEDRRPVISHGTKLPRTKRCSLPPRRQLIYRENRLLPRAICARLSRRNIGREIGAETCEIASNNTGAVVGVCFH